MSTAALAPASLETRERERLLLFAAAEAILLRGDCDALTPDSIEGESLEAAEILARGFPDFDSFLAALLSHHLGTVLQSLGTLRPSVGHGTVESNLASALLAAFSPLTVHHVILSTSRAPLRPAAAGRGVRGIPVLVRAGAEVSGYLSAERDLGRIARTADVDRLAQSIVGAVHLLTEGSRGTVDPFRVEEAVESVLDAHLT